MKTFLLILTAFILSINAIAIDDFHCKIPTCRDFYYGLRHLRRYGEYEDACYDTVFTLQAIPREHGKCINEKTGKINENCIYALAATIKRCIHRLDGLLEHQARFYCGFTLMKYCAIHLGLDGYPLNFKNTV